MSYQYCLSSSSDGFSDTSVRAGRSQPNICVSTRRHMCIHTEGGCRTRHKPSFGITEKSKITKSVAVKMVRHHVKGFWRVWGSVRKKYVGVDRCVMNITFVLMLKMLKVNLETQNLLLSSCFITFVRTRAFLSQTHASLLRYSNYSKNNVWNIFLFFKEK